MATVVPTPAELQALIFSSKTRSPLSCPPTGPAPAAVAFADTPQPLYADDLIDYSTKQGSSIYEQGCKTLDDKALTDGFGMTPDQTVVFIESLTCRATAMGWNAGSKQITTFRQKEDKAWKKIPPKDGDKKSKEMGKHTFHWCEHHMAWCMHLPSQGGTVTNCWRQLCHLCHCCRLYRQTSIPRPHCQHARLAGAVQ
jgi:hypothetical protein